MALVKDGPDKYFIVLILITASFLPIFSAVTAITTGLRRTSAVVFKNVFKFQATRLNSHNSKGIGRPCHPLWHLQKQMHPAFTAARTEADVDAGELVHHLYNRGDLLLRRTGYPHQSADGGKVLRPVSVG